RIVGAGIVRSDVSLSVIDAFSFASEAALGSARIIYDGDSNHGVNTNPGLGSIDLTQGGINTGISTSGLSLDRAITLSFNLYTDSPHESTGKATLPIGQPTPMGTNLAPIFISFADFVPTGGSGGATLSNIHAIEIQ